MDFSNFSLKSRKGQWIKNPAWAKFYLHLGKHIGERINNKTRFVIALTVPNKAYCASLVGLGVVKIRSLKSKLMSHDCDTHFDFLSQLELGTMMRYQTKDKQIKVKYVGRDSIGDLDFIKIQIEKKKKNASPTFELVPKDKCRSLSPDYEITESGVGRVLQRGNEFNIGVFDDAHEGGVLGESRNDFVSIGRVSSFKEETESTRLSVESFKNKELMGYLSEYLKIKNFQGSQEIFRTKLFPNMSGKPDDGEDYRDTVVAFNGAASFLKWSSYWKDSNWVAIFDSSESDFEEGVQVMNKTYIEQTTGDDTITELKSMQPEGIEMLFLETLRSKE